MKIFKIGIIDDHVLFAEGISNIITNNPSYELSFITNSVEELHRLLSNNNIDILLLDINIPPHNGIEMISQLKSFYHNLKIMALTMYQPSDIGLKILQFKGDAYVLKISGKHILEEALLQLTKNERYLDPNIIVNIPIEDNFANNLKLTRREKEIIALIADGKTSKEIAAQLYLSELTIKTHRKNISEKLGSKGVADLISKTNQIR
jgi:DNA-binding NarL/FixJ family response regulator